MKEDNSKDNLISYNSKMVGNEVLVVSRKNLSNWRGKVEKVIDEEYFEISKYENPLETEIISMYDIRSLSYESK
jgi:hypothetical protein